MPNKFFQKISQFTEYGSYSVVYEEVYLFLLLIIFLLHLSERLLKKVKYEKYAKVSFIVCY